MIRVLLFAHLRTVCGATEQTVEPAAAPTGEALWSLLESRHPGLAPVRGSVRLAVNGVFSPMSAPLKSGDEAAFIPPVSGG